MGLKFAKIKLEAFKQQDCRYNATLSIDDHSLHRFLTDFRQIETASPDDLQQIPMNRILISFKK